MPLKCPVCAEDGQKFARVDLESLLVWNPALHNLPLRSDSGALLCPYPGGSGATSTHIYQGRVITGTPAVLLSEKNCPILASGDWYLGAVGWQQAGKSGRVKWLNWPRSSESTRYQRSLENEMVLLWEGNYSAWFTLLFGPARSLNDFSLWYTNTLMKDGGITCGDSLEVAEGDNSTCKRWCIELVMVLFQSAASSV